MTQCNISWHSFRKDICHGLTLLQQEQEFVDMTLAADGHMVKVHRNLIALSSPYFREMLHSIPCQHPVIFLNNIGHDILILILEYIYTGEVNVPVEKINLLLEAAKAFHIKGLQGELASTIPESLLCQDTSQNNANSGTNICNNLSTRTTLLNKRRYASENTGKQNNERNKSRKGNNETKNVHEKQCANKNTIEIENFDDLIEYHSSAGSSISNTNNAIVTFSKKDNPSQNKVTSLTQPDKNNYFITNTITNKNKDQYLDQNDRNDSMQTIRYNDLPVVLSLGHPNDGDNYNEQFVNNLNIVTDQGNKNLAKNLVIHKTNADTNLISAKNFVILPHPPSSEFANKNKNDDNSTPTINIQVDLNQINQNTKDATSSFTKGNVDVESMEMGNEYTDTFMNTGTSTIYNKTETSSQPFIVSQSRDSISQHKHDEHTKSFSVEVLRQETPTKSIHIDLQANTVSQGELNNTDNLENSPLFVLTSRGCLQLILNRYMYYCHYGAFSGRKRRWRCIDYRKLKCKAFIDTEGGVIICRKFVHTHPFHDAKIFKKGQSSIVHTSLAQILEEAAKKNGPVFESETIDDGSENE